MKLMDSHLDFLQLYSHNIPNQMFTYLRLHSHNMLSLLKLNFSFNFRFLCLSMLHKHSLLVQGPMYCANTKNGLVQQPMAVLYSLHLVLQYVLLTYSAIYEKQEGAEAAYESSLVLLSTLFFAGQVHVHRTRFQYHLSQGHVKAIYSFPFVADCVLSFNCLSFRQTLKGEAAS